MDISSLRCSSWRLLLTLSAAEGALALVFLFSRTMSGAGIMPAGITRTHLLFGFLLAHDPGDGGHRP